MADDTGLETCLRNAELYTLVNTFQREKIELDQIKGLSDQELVRLGVTTIGERVRLRDCAKEQLNTPRDAVAASSNSSESRRFRNVLFTGNRHPARQHGQGKTKKRCHGWTGQFFCLADHTQNKIPTASEKEVLRKAGLGLKKIRLEHDDTEEMVINKLMCPEIEEDGFPQLKHACGFEMTRTLQNGRQLSLIDIPWSSSELKAKVGPQARIYLRPIQKSLATNPKTANDNMSTVREKCEQCGTFYLLHEMRIHVEQCTGLGNIDDPEPTGSPTDSHTETYLIYDNVPDTITTVIIDAGNTIVTQPDHEPDRLNIDLIIQQCQGLHNPVEILKMLQQEIVSGRPLEVADESASVEGDTNDIFVDRENLLKTGMDEIKELENLRLTLDVQFYNENAVDLGGPRKEFFRLILMEIQEKYFDHGVRDLLCDEYKTIGIIFALSILQNGKMPTFIHGIQDELWNSAHPSAAVKKLREGLDTLGLFRVGVELPSFQFILHPTTNILTIKKLINILTPIYGPEGSNSFVCEKAVFGRFIKYLREVAAGRRPSVTLEAVLSFVTSSDEEPVLGYKIHPEINFHDAMESYIPTANTCINRLCLPKAPTLEQLPDEDTMFSAYDYAFCNTFFGLK